jgi:uncharacterized protein (UPF0335 family)
MKKPKAKQTMTNGLSDDTINEIINIGKWTRANAELDEAKAEFKDVEVYVKGNGIDVKALKEARRICASEKRDPYLEYLQKVFVYARYLGAEIDARTIKQLDLFQTDLSSEPADDRAFNEGRTMFLLSFGDAEKPTCPHMEGTPSARSWWSGWEQGKAEAERVMALAPKDELIKEGSGDPFADFVAGIDEAAPEAVTEDAEWEAAAPEGSDDFVPPIPPTPKFDADEPVGDDEKDA